MPREVAGPTVNHRMMKLIPLNVHIHIYGLGEMGRGGGWLGLLNMERDTCKNEVAPDTLGRIIQFGMECVLKCGGCSILVYEIALFEICSCVSRGVPAAAVWQLTLIFSIWSAEPYLEQRFANIVKR